MSVTSLLPAGAIGCDRSPRWGCRWSDAQPSASVCPPVWAPPPRPARVWTRARRARGSPARGGPPADGAPRSLPLPAPHVVLALLASALVDEGPDVRVIAQSGPEPQLGGAVADHP